MCSKWVSELERLLASPESPAFRAIGYFLDSQVWYRISGLVAASVVAHTMLSLLATEASHEGSLTFAVLSVGCGLANIAAFASYRPQVCALIGGSGIAPANQLLKRLRRLPFRSAPTVFRFPAYCTDSALLAACDAGLLCGLTLAALPFGGDFAARVAVFVAPFLWLTAGFAYLSLLLVSGDFLGLQSDSNLVEVDMLMGVLSLVAPSHPQAAVIIVRFFAFRKMLGCGVCKYYGSPMWRRFTALQAHYFTQPLVNPRSVRSHRLPKSFHRFSVLATFIVEVTLPFLAWGPRPLRLLAWMGFNGLNAMINASGNYGFIGFLNTVENLSLTDDSFWGWVAGSGGRYSTTAPLWTPWLLRAVATCVLSAYVVLSLDPLARAAKGNVGPKTLWLPLRLTAWLDRMQELQRPFRLVNYQGKFSGMHDYRWEPILEGSIDGGETWHQFRWRYKLNEGQLESGVVLWLHLPRLDWRVWFLPLGARRGNEPPDWYHRLLAKLAELDPAVLRLLAGSPFEQLPEAGSEVLVRSRLVDCSITPGGWHFEPVRHRTSMSLLVRGTCGCEKSAKRPRAST